MKKSAKRKPPTPEKENHNMVYPEEFIKILGPEHQKLCREENERALERSKK